MSSQSRRKVFEHVGHGSGSVCLDEGPLCFLLRFKGPGLRAPEVLGWSATTKLRFGSRSNSKQGCVDAGNAELSGEISVPGSLAEAVKLRRVLPSIEVD